MWFGVAAPKLGRDEHAFDATSLAMTSFLRTRVPYGSRVIDLGTGSAAILGLWMWKRLGCRVTSVEIDEDIARRARETITLNAAPLEVLKSNLFEHLHGAFDAVVFNPPYVSTSSGERRGLPTSTRSQWDGGADGMRVIAAFAQQVLVERAFLGINRRHVTRETMEARLAAHPQIELRERSSHFCLPVDLYVLVKRKSPSASASSPVESKQRSASSCVHRMGSSCTSRDVLITKGSPLSRSNARAHITCSPCCANRTTRETSPRGRCELGSARLSRGAREFVLFEELVVQTTDREHFFESSAAGRTHRAA